jgi:uncharacterized protein YdeI (BOF family)
MTTLKLTGPGAFMALVMTVVAASATAGPAQYGATPPDTAQTAKLSDVIKNADSYSDRTIVATGLFYGTDADGDDFYLKDGADIIEVAPPDGTRLMTDIKANTPVAVYGKVLVRHRGDKAVVHMAASGVSVP